MSTNEKRIIYLACPYTDVSAEVRERRFQIATEIAAKLIKRGHIVFSPITMTHPIDKLLAGEAATLGSDFWTTFDETFMAFCSELAIIRIAGWDQSSGIKREREFFAARSLPISFIDP